MKRTIVAIGIVAMLFSCAPKAVNISELGEFNVQKYNSSTVETDSCGITVTSTREYGTGGVSMIGQWDLSDYNAIRFKVTNHDELEHLILVTELCNAENKTIPWVAFSFSGKTHDRNHIRPGETVTVTVDFPCVMEHPEINEQFTTMLNTPYSVSQFYYNADLSDIREIRFYQRYNKYGLKWTVSDVEFLKGERPDAPDYMSLSEEEFFPFIDKYGQFRYRDWPGKIHSDEELVKAREDEARNLEANPGPQEWSRWGGWAAGPRYEATGRFRTQKIDGKWWLIDPDGYLFWSHGVLRISPASAVTSLSAPGMADRRKYFEELPSKDDPEYGKFYETFDPILGSYYEARGIDDHYDFSSANCYRKYGPDYMTEYGEIAHKRLRSWGMNTIANSSEQSICDMRKTPYCDRLEIRSKPLSTTAKTIWWKLPDPFDPDFRNEIIRQLEARKDMVNDPWCLGLFVDNEHVWGDGDHVTQCAIEAPEGAAVKVALNKWLKEKYGKLIPYGDMTAEDKSQFNDVVIEKYYSTIREEFDRLAPGLLYMGCRFGGHPGNPNVITIGAKYCDLISFNIYKYNLDCFKLPEGIDKPVLIGEFHFGAMDRGPFHPGQVDTENQDDRAACYKDYVLSALEHPNFVGTHWHQFSDQATTGRFDGENFQVGFTDVCDTPYEETVEAAREIGYNMYRIRHEGITRR